MKSKYCLFLLLLGVLLFALNPESITLAKEDPPEVIDAGGDRAQITPLIGYQGRLTENGQPVTGDRSMKFKLYKSQSGGTSFWTETKIVSIEDGLFQTALGDTAALNPYTMDGDIWIEVEVDGTILPRQRLLGAPYALSLAPGATIFGSNLPAPNYMLHVLQQGDGVAIRGWSTGGEGVEGVSQQGIGVTALTSSTDHHPALFAQSYETSDIFQGHGGDGDSDYEFAIENDGTVKQDTAADGLVKAGVVAYCGETDSEINRNFGGTITIDNGDDIGNCLINFDFDISKRYWSGQSLENATYHLNCYRKGDTQLQCYNRSDTEGFNDGLIMLLVY